MCYKELPEGYTLLDKIDLKNNKKQFWLVQGLSILILVVMAVIGFLITGVDFYSKEELLTKLISLIVLIVGLIVYVIAHELTHGLVMYLSVKAKLNFGFNFIFAYVGTTGYLDKKHYILVALAPLVLWGIVLGILNVFFNTGVWFWTIWIIQIQNIGGSSGDLFCTYKMLRYPKDILVHDSGMAMLVFRRKTQEELSRESEVAEDKEEEKVD